MSTPSPSQVLILGAGMSGLMAAHVLREADVPVRLLDKGRGVGGRMSTRRIGDARCDHGAQFFTINDARFEHRAAAWQDAGVIDAWADGFVDASGTARHGGRVAWRGATGMNALPKALAADLDVATGVRVTALSIEDDGYGLAREDGEVERASAVLLTAPVPQTLALFDAGDVRLDASLRARLEAITYDPCFAVMACLDGPSRIPPPGAVRLDEGPVAWIADNQQKGISPEVPAITIHARADWTRAHWDTPRDEVGRLLLDAAAAWIGATATTVQVHGWLYSLPHGRTDEAFVPVTTAPPLVLAGDAFGGAAVEGAALSGLAAGAWLRDQMGRV